MTILSPERWLAQAHEELEALLAAPIESVPGDDAWRMLALAARLHFASPRVTSPGIPSTWTEPMAQALAARIHWPEHPALLQELHEVLEETDEPWGEFLDCVLDIGDACAIATLLGDAAEARLLAQRAGEIVSSVPQCSAGLAAFAEMRIAGLRENAPERALWESVAHSAARAGAMPISILDRTSDEQPAQLRLKLPASLTALAAHSDLGESFDLVGPRGEEATCYVEGGRREIDLRYPAERPSPTAVQLLAVERGTGLERGRLALPFERQGEHMYIDLGGEIGKGNRIQELLARIGSGEPESDLYLSVEYDEPR